MPRHAVADESALTLIAPDKADAIASEILSQLSKDSKGYVFVQHTGTARAKFTRNDIHTVENDVKLTVELRLEFKSGVGGRAVGGTTRLDPQGLRDLVQSTEEAARTGKKDTEVTVVRDPATFTDPKIFFDATVSNSAPTVQGDALRAAAQAVRAAGFMGAGTAEANGEFRLVKNTAGFNGHARFTYAEYTATVRSPNGTSSGWAWAGAEDSSKVDSVNVTGRAIDLCRRSDKAVAVEPGRYTVIMEPEAVAQLAAPITDFNTYWMSAGVADMGMTVYSKKEGGNKIGLQMADRRVQIHYAPNDPDLPFTPLGRDGSIIQSQDWLGDGILKDLYWLEDYARMHNRKATENPNGRAKLQVAGPTQELDAMIAGTQRGIWVHHFAGVTQQNGRTLLMSGTTADGTFLIENGKVTRPIRNLRFTESPFFVLNRILASGQTQRSSRYWATPRLKFQDFNFTSLSDAV